jgi:hypothetical protein
MVEHRLMLTGEKGNLSEAKILAAFVAAGYLVSLPFGSGHKYDFVVDDSTRLFRVQCKTGRVKRSVLYFNAYSQSGNGSVKMGYRGLADLFAVLNPEDDKVYLVPVDEVGMTIISLRLAPTLNKQAQRVRWAESYRLKPLDLSGCSAMVAHQVPNLRVAGSSPVARSKFL